MFVILLKFSMLNNFGSAYTMKNLDDESYLDLQYLQVCLNAQVTYQEMQSKKVTHVGSYD